MNATYTTPSEAFESVYPDFLRTGLGKLSELDSRRELLALFSALEHFRHDLHQQDSGVGILGVSHRYVMGLNLFRAMGFWLVNPQDMSFVLTLASPEGECALLQRTVDEQIKAGRFALALRRSSPVVFGVGAHQQSDPGLLHGLSLSSQAVGMFCGLLHREAAPAHEVAFSLLSLLLGECADALATLRKTTQLTNQVETLSGLLPLCAWCKKVRNDSGYWEQIDKYITTHSSTALTHGVCPECKANFLAGMSPLG
jgi:hypothetical protein